MAQYQIIPLLGSVFRKLDCFRGIVRTKNEVFIYCSVKLAFTLIILLVVVLAGSSCRKTKNNGGSRITQVFDTVYNRLGQDSSGTYYNFSYSSNGSLQKIISAGADIYGHPYVDSVIFTYEPGIVVINHVGRQDTFLLNAYGDIFTEKHTRDSIKYTGNEVVFNAFDGPYTNHIWSAGNMVEMYSFNNIDTVTFDYYSDRPYATGDYLQIKESLNWGRSITHNHNLLRAIQYKNGTIDDFTYTYDNKNRIVTCKLTQASNYYYEQLSISYND